MSEKRLKRQHLKKKILNKNRLILLNENTFEELFSIKLNLLNVFGGTFTLFFVLIVSTGLLIAFTPLRELIPGYSSSEQKRKVLELSLRSDSLEKEIQKNEVYLTSLKHVLSGEIEVSRQSLDSLAINESSPIARIEELQPSEQDLKLREMVRLEDKYNVFHEAKPKVDVVLFAPVTGSIVQRYDANEKHFALDVAVPKDTPIKAVAKGTVLFSDWTPNDGYSLIILHEEGIVSVYKHASMLTKSQGEGVKTGEVVALSGGGVDEASHFHFELWKGTTPLDPTLFIDFE